MSNMATDTIMDDLKLKFDGKTHQIDANTLINNLLHFNNIVQEVNKDLQTHRKIEIKINALEKGSFLVHIILQSNVLEAVGDFFTQENLQTAANIVVVVGGLYGAAKFFKGKKGEVLETNDISVKIKNERGDVTYIDNRVFNIYQNNRVVRESLSKEFETLENDENVTSFEILDKQDNVIVGISKEDFSLISELEEIETQPDERLVIKTGILSIASLSFENNIKWAFYYEGNKFSAKINDDEFVRLVDSGEKFAKGDALEAEFEIKQEYYEPANTYINKSYRILKIIKHIPRSEQGRLNFTPAE